MIIWQLDAKMRGPENLKQLKNEADALKLESDEIASSLVCC